MPSAAPLSCSRVVTGAEYVQQITWRQSDRRARAAFRELVLGLLPRGANLFDFGCGTGMDARFYAQRGVTVAAYDVDRQMCDFLLAECQDLVQRGQVRLEAGSYEEFLARRDRDVEGGIDLVTANFAPLSLIADLPQLFAKFARLTRPNGRVLASVLNPYFLGDAVYGWWWRHLATLIASGSYAIAGAQAPIFRRRLSVHAASGLPHFRLRGVYRGLPARSRRSSAAKPLQPRRHTWLRLATCRFMFLLFEKC